jgi:CHAT domain-containing protein
MLPARRALGTQCEILRRALGDLRSSEASSTRRAARGLYQRLLAPVEPELKGVKRVIVAPDGPLALIPFEALLTADVPAEGEIPRSAWLVQRYDVSYVASATVLAGLLHDADDGVKNAAIVAVGDPRFTPDSVATPSLPRLPHTAEEIEAIRALKKKREFQALTGADATREALLATPALPQASVIHIATHGTADEADPRKSGLWLAAPAGQSQPGFLALEDIERLHLRAGLVTLSACETGLGRLETGEGVIGLTRAFMAAGARSVVVSLWKVNDQSTARLMSAFYQKALPGKTPCDAALASAKRKLLEDPATRAPFHWAPFVLQGAAQSLD